MPTFLISYDLSQPAANKSAVTSAIMMLGASWARPLDQTWYIKADLEDSDIESVLGSLLGDDDGLLVQRVEHDAMLANTQLRWFRQRSKPLAGVETNVVAFPSASTAGFEDHADDFALAG
jgi:hypothetical protein